MDRLKCLGNAVVHQVMDGIEIARIGNRESAEPGSPGNLWLIGSPQEIESGAQSTCREKVKTWRLEPGG